MKLRLAFVALLMTLVMAAGCANPAAIQVNTENIRQLQSRSDSMAKEINDMSSLLNDMMIRVSIMNSHIDKLSNVSTDEDMVVDDEMRFIEQEISRIGRRISDIEAISSPGSEMLESKQPLTVKVLTGTGDIRTAKNLASVLKKSGYDVAVVDYAASDIYQNTVFYASGFRNEALNLMRIMGKDTIVKPLTWSSMFKLIVVKGR